MMTSQKTNLYYGSKAALFNNVSPKFYQQGNITPENKNIRNVTFQAATKLTVTIGQFFGLNPVLGISETDTSKQRFQFISERCLYTIVTILMQTSLVFMSLYKSLTNTDTKLTDNTFVVFYVSNTMLTALFLQMARKWPKLNRSIAKIESSDPLLDSKLIKRCNIACIIILSLALLEHLASNLSGIFSAKECQPDVSGFDAFCLQWYPWVWTWLTYNSVYGVIVLFTNFQLTFNWNFADAFVICISIYLTARLKQINNRLLAVRGKLVPSSFWRVMREEYTRTSNLVRKVDDVIGGIIFISFANNLFFICLQLLNTLEGGFKVSSACGKSLDDRPFKGYEKMVYYVYSFAFLMGRSLSVCLIAARVHTESQKPAQVLFDVPSASYCVEVQRFLCQVHVNTVALSGLKFFSVTRGMVLTVAGTIVTYELVLMQFAGVTPTAASDMTS